MKTAKSLLPFVVLVLVVYVAYTFYVSSEGFTDSSGASVETVESARAELAADKAVSNAMDIKVKSAYSAKVVSNREMRNTAALAKNPSKGATAAEIEKLKSSAAAAHSVAEADSDLYKAALDKSAAALKVAEASRKKYDAVVKVAKAAAKKAATEKADREEIASEKKAWGKHYDEYSHLPVPTDSGYKTLVKEWNDDKFKRNGSQKEYDDYIKRHKMTPSTIYRFYMAGAEVAPLENNRETHSSAFFYSNAEKWAPHAETHLDSHLEPHLDSHLDSHLGSHDSSGNHM